MGITYVNVGKGDRKCGAALWGLQVKALLGFSMSVAASTSWSADGNCKPFAEILEAARGGFVSAQVMELSADGNFVGSRLTLQGASECRVYHDDERTYHSLDCRFSVSNEAAAQQLFAAWASRASTCAGTQPEEMPANAAKRLFAESKVGLAEIDGEEPQIRVSHVADRDAQHYVTVSVALSTQEPTGAAVDLSERAAKEAATKARTDALLLRLRLSIAASEGNLEGIKSSLASGADPNGGADARTSPLWLAIVSGDLSAVSLLLQAGANVNAKVAGDSMFQLALTMQRKDILRVLMTEGRQAVRVAEPNARDERLFGSPLLQVVNLKDPDLLEMFLARCEGINFDAKDVLGRSVIEVAAGEPKLLEVLLRHRPTNH
jgi:hypothetical protein